MFSVKGKQLWERTALQGQRGQDKIPGAGGNAEGPAEERRHQGDAHDHNGARGRAVSGLEDVIEDLPHHVPVSLPCEQVGWILEADEGTATQGSKQV